MELLILYTRVQFYTHWASDYRLISQTENSQVVSTLKFCTDYAKNISYFHRILLEMGSFCLSKREVTDVQMS